jgi:hypothetical protein
MKLQDLDSLVLNFISGSEGRAFEDVRLAVARYQAEWNTPLREFWRRRGYDPASAAPQAPPPAVPTDVFRSIHLRSSERNGHRIFRTSGTTSGARGEHHRLSLAAYDEGALRWFAHCTDVRPETHHIARLVFDDQQVDDSSLAHMAGLFARTLGIAPSPSFLDSESGLDVEAAVGFMNALSRPTVVLGTAFAFVHLMDEWSGSITLPEGSIVIDTGGFKGKSREVSRARLLEFYGDQLGVPAHRCLSEYSMTELSSQLYTTGIVTGQSSHLYAAPPWLRVTAVDPVSLVSLPDGETGLLRFDDLANTDSVVAIQTSDLGRVTTAGVELFGRAGGATPRGCSLAMEELLAIRDR